MTQGYFMALNKGHMYIQGHLYSVQMAVICFWW